MMDQFGDNASFVVAMGSNPSALRLNLDNWTMPAQASFRSQLDLFSRGEHRPALFTRIRVLKAMAVRDELFYLPRSAAPNEPP
jgi:hypothetical protein